MGGDHVPPVTLHPSLTVRQDSGAATGWDRFPHAGQGIRALSAGISALIIIIPEDGGGFSRAPHGSTAGGILLASAQSAQNRCKLIV